MLPYVINLNLLFPLWQFKNANLGNHFSAREIAQWVKYLSLKHEDWSSDAQESSNAGWAWQPGLSAESDCEYCISESGGRVMEDKSPYQHL